MVDDKRAISECKDIFVRVEPIIKILNQDIIHKKISKDDDVISIKSRISKIHLFISMYENKIERIWQSKLNINEKNNIINLIKQSSTSLKKVMDFALVLLNKIGQRSECDEIFSEYQEQYIKYINDNDKLISLLNKHLH